jgi:hypothetical protein
VVVVVKAGVLNEPEVPVPPPPDEEHEVLLVDDHETVVLALYAIELDVAAMVTVGVMAGRTVIIVF